MQIGSSLGSWLAQAVGLEERRFRLLVACGAARGIAATFNAPLAGVFFAMELILGHWAAESFGMVVVSSVTASVVGRAVLGDDPFLTLPDFHVAHLVQYPLFALLVGAAFGAVAQYVAPGTVGSPGAYALVGTGVLFAGAARAPITAVVILFELTEEYTIILPLMLAIVLTTGASHLASRDVMDALASADEVELGDLVRRESVSDTDQAADAWQRLDAGADAVAVTDEGHRLVGWVRHRDLLTALSGQR